MKELKIIMTQHIDNMVKDQKKIFVTDVSKDEMWETYLNSFPAGTNEIYRERRAYDCNACKHFIRVFGNAVTVDSNNELVSIWDVENAQYPFDIVCKSMSEFVKSKPIRDIHISDVQALGTDCNKELSEDKVVNTWYHLYYKLPKKFITTGSAGSEMNKYRTGKQVFQRGMNEITLDAVRTVMDIIDQGSLYKGEEFYSALQAFLKYKEQYKDIPEDKKDNWCWINSIDNPVSRMNNSAMGTLLNDISEGMDLDSAVKRWEKIVAPTNYKRPKPIFTKKMVEAAEAKIKELGYEESLGRRHASLRDVSVDNVIFANSDAKGSMMGSVFDELKEEVTVNPKSFSKVEEVTIEKFIKDVVPNSKSVELLLEGKHTGNFVSLIAPKDKTAPSMFKWNNGFSWAYQGDVTDSIKQNVKKAGGNVDGILRFSIQWNDRGDYNRNDFDAHCIEPNGNEIYFSNCKKPGISKTTGQLDVDIVNPTKDVPAVENITWTDIDKMLEGEYTFFVHNFSHNGGHSGFSAEIEYNGDVYSFDYDKELKSHENVTVAKIRFSKKDGITFISSLDSSVSSREVWGVKTQKFVNVSTIMYSPNYWDLQEGIGNKHYFFFLDGCKNEVSPRGFYNEFLSNELMEHRKVFEALGGKLRVEDSNEQLSGVGFSSTQRNSIIARVTGNIQRVVKINF